MFYYTCLQWGILEYLKFTMDITFASIVHHVHNKNLLFLYSKLDDKALDGAAKKKKEEEVMALTTRTGGAYIPPARLRAMQASITDKSR